VAVPGESSETHEERRYRIAWWLLRNLREGWGSEAGCVRALADVAAL
jgi:hypothetical protein